MIGIWFEVQEGIDEAGAAALGVVLIEPADEDHHFAAVGHGLAERLATHQASLVVIHADVDEPIRVRCVGVVRDEIGLGGGLVDGVDLVIRIDRADRDAVDAARQQVFDLAGLVSPASRCNDGDVDIEILPGLINVSSMRMAPGGSA